MDLVGLASSVGLKAGVALLRKGRPARKLAKAACAYAGIKWSRRRVLAWLKTEHVRSALVAAHQGPLDQITSDLEARLRHRRLIPSRWAASRTTALAQAVVSYALSNLIAAEDPSTAIAMAHFREVGLIQLVLERTERIENAMLPAIPPADLLRLPPPAQVAAQEALLVDAKPAARLLRLLVGMNDSDLCTGIRVLLEDPAPWLAQAAGETWLVMAEFASAHRCADLASKTFERAAMMGAPDRAGCLTRAAFHALDSAPDRARGLIEQARIVRPTDSFTDLVSLLADRDHDAVLNRTADPQLWNGSQHAGLAFAVRAHILFVRGEFDACIAAAAAGRALSPRSTALLIEDARARVAKAFRPSGRISIPDLEEAISRARAAAAERRAWGGPAGEAIDVACAAAIRMHEWTRVLELTEVVESTLPPTDIRTDEVLGHAVMACLVLDRHDQAELLADQIKEPYARAIARAALSRDDIAARENVYEALIEATTADDVVKLQLELVLLGSTDVPRLDETRVFSQVQASFIDAILAENGGRYDDAIRYARRWAPEHLGSARLLVRALHHRGDIEQAVAAAREAFGRFADHELLLLSARALYDVGRLEEADEELGQALEAQPAPQLRQLLIRARIEIAQARGDWGAVRRLAQDALDAGAEDHDVRWLLAGAQYNVGDYGEAWRTLAGPPALDPVDDQRAKLWLDLMRREALSADNVSAAVRLAERFPDNEQLVASVVVSLGLLPLEIELPETTRSQLRILGDSFFERFPESEYLVKFSAPTPTALLEDMKARIEPGSAARRELFAKFMRSEVPIAVLSMASGQAYGETVVRVRGSILPIESPYDDIRLEERQTAKSALEKDVVTEASVFYVGALIPEIWGEIRTSFASTAISSMSFQDLLRSRDALSLGGSGSLSWNPSEEHWEYSELDDDELTEQRRIADFMVSEARKVKLVYRRELVVYADFDEAATGGWAGALELARESGLPLYSDDFVLRGIARAEGIPSFGTTAVLDALVDRGLLAEDSARSARVRLLRAKGVDMAVECAEVREAIALDEYRCVGAAISLTRPSFWRDRVSAYDVYQEACANSASEGDRAGWVAAAAYGLTWNATGASATQEIASLLAATILRYASESGSAADMVQAARQVARERSAQDPLDPTFRLVLAAHNKSGTRPDIAARRVLALATGLDKADRDSVVRLLIGGS